MPSSRRTVLWAALASIAAWHSTGHAGSAVQVEGVEFDTRLVLAGESLKLNGTGVRAVAWLKGYAAALYLGRIASTTEQVLAQPGPKRLRMRMLLDVPVAEFVKAIHKGIARNVPADRQAQLTERIQRFDQAILPLERVKKGDTIDLDYLSDRGLVCSHNGRMLGTPIPGDDFYDAMLGIFIGPHPVDDELKAGLLGGSS